MSDCPASSFPPLSQTGDHAQKVASRPLFLFFPSWFEHIIGSHSYESDHGAAPLIIQTHSFPGTDTLHHRNLVAKHARQQAAKPVMWGGKTPSAGQVEQLANACASEWTRALHQLLRHWEAPPTM